MATTQTTPQEPEVTLLKVDKEVLDLDSKGYVTLVKEVPEPSPITTMEEFVSKLGNDAQTILKYANVAFLQFFKDNLASNPDVPWMLPGDEDEPSVPWNGTPINPEKEKGFELSVITVAKAMFGYSKSMVEIPENGTKEEKAAAVEANRAAKKAAKDSARTFLLSNPAALTMLK